MRRSVLVRLSAVALAAGSVVAIAAGPASAAPVVACSKATITTNLKAGTSTSVMSQCTNPSVSGGGAKLVANFKNLKAITAKITWNGGKGTTSYKVSEVAGPKTNNCHGTGANKDALINSTGKFVSGTGKAGTALKGLVYKESLCVTKTESTYLLPGSKITFG